MKIIVTDPENLYEGRITIEVKTDKYTGEASFGAGEPEDNCLARDLNDAFQIEDLIVAAYYAGKDGEDFQIIHQKEGE